MLKKIFQKIWWWIKKFFLWIILPLFIIFQFYYYLDFGEYRSLTSGEIKFLKSVYQDQIKYQNIKLYSRKFLPIIQPDNVAMTPNGNIYFPKKYYKKDFSKADVLDQAWLVHEVMHIKQYQDLNQLFIWLSLDVDIKNFLGKDVYDYKIDYSKKLNDYNTEQQGEIARYYFLNLKNKVQMTEKEAQWHKKLLDLE